MKKSQLLAAIAGFATLVAAPLAFATDYSMSSLSAPSALAADAIAAGSSGAQFSLTMLASILGSVLVVGFVGYVLATFTRLVSAGLHVGRR